MRALVMLARVQPDQDDHSDKLLVHLRALASPVRLRLLKSLVSPTRAPDVRVPAGRARAGFEPQRFLGRSTVIEHLEVLVQAGLVRRVGEEYVVDQQGMVALLQDLGALAKLRALIEVDVESTRPAKPPLDAELPPTPRLTIVSGPEAGRAFGLVGDGPWELGRAPGCDIPLPHDPHVSRLHVLVARAADGFTVRVADVAKNAAWVDFARMEPGALAAVRPGAVVTVGATTLVLQS